MRGTAAFARLGTTSADAGVAAALCLLVVSELHGDMVDNPFIAVAAAVPTVLSFAWRRTWPGPVLIAICLLDLYLSATSPHEFPPQLMTIAIVAAVANAAVHLESRPAYFYGPLSLVLIVAAHISSNDGDPGDFLPYVFWVVPWVSGRLVRRRTSEAARAAAESVRLVAEHEAAARQAVRDERDRIARELHDVVAHAVSVMVVQAGAERVNLDPSADRTRRALEDIESTGREALTELRVMLTALRDSDDGEGTADLAPQPTLADVPALVDRVRAAGLPVELTTTGAVEAVPPGVGLAVYRIVQESLTNVIKHATGPAQVLVSVDEGCVRTVVTSPLRPARAGSARSDAGRGLIGMRERVSLHGGTMSSGRVGDAWVVKSVLPVTAPAMVRR
jgi:signal transduction histidine kinase